MHAGSAILALLFQVLVNLLGIYLKDYKTEFKHILKGPLQLSCLVNTSFYGLFVVVIFMVQKERWHMALNAHLYFT